jgi:hypothetical protein
MAKLSAVLASTLALAAAAYPTDTKPYCGKIAPPSYMASLQKYPDPYYYGTPSTSALVSKTWDHDKLASEYAEVVAFDGPMGSYGCQLSMYFPEDMDRFYKATGYDGKAMPPMMNVYKVEYPMGEEKPSYAELKKKGGLFGTATVRPGKQVINTMACPTAEEGGMAYLFEIPDWIQATSSAKGDNYIDVYDFYSSIGIYVNYDC